MTVAYPACACGKPCVWWYAPESENQGERAYCDDCVRRGCSCNVDYETGEVFSDRHGRELPCCEYDYLPWVEHGIEP